MHIFTSFYEPSSVPTSSKRKCNVSILFDVVFAEFKKDILRIVLEASDSVKELSSDVRHMHYLVTKSSRIETGGLAAGSNEDRITDFIPCHTYKELQELNRRLDVDKGFMDHSVS